MEEIDRLVAWLEEAGGCVGPVAVRATATGRGVYASRAIAAGEVLVRVPVERVITAPLAAREGPPLLVDTLWPGAGKQQLILSSFLLSRDCDPAWAPYFATLPAELGFHPLFWPDLEDLRGSLFLELLEARRRVYLQEHTWMCTAFAPYTPLDADAWIRARTLVSSRSFAIDALGNEALVPFADLFDHSLQGTVRWACEDGVFSLVTHAPAAAGQPLHVNYGAKQNVRLFLYYGFTLADNPIEGTVLDLGSNGRYALTRDEDALEMREMVGLIDADRSTALALLADTCRERLSRLPKRVAHLDAMRIVEEERKILSYWVSRAS